MMEEIDEKVDMNIKELKLLCKTLAVVNGNDGDRYSYNVDKVSMLIEEINMQNKKRIDLYQSVISKELTSIKEEMIMNNTFMLRNQYYNCYNDDNHKCIIEQQQQQQQLCGDHEHSKQLSRNKTVVNTNQTNEFTLNNNNNSNVVVQTQTIEINKQNSNNKNHSHSKQVSSSSLHVIQPNKPQIKTQSIKSITDIPQTHQTHQTRSHHSFSKRNNNNNTSTNNNNDLIHNSSSNTNSNNTINENEPTPKDLLTIFHSQYINRDNNITSDPSITNLTKQLT